jgi:ferredoxin-fold anticodon binding domain-containing protein
MDQAALLVKVKTMMGDLSTKVSDLGYVEAVETAEVELGWTLPLSDSESAVDKFKRNWMARRTQRHVLHLLRVVSADKFKHKQENLQHRFEQYSALIKSMDEEFLQTVEENPDMFSNVDVERLFGTYVGPGFVYDVAGNDITYKV